MGLSIGACNPMARRFVLMARNFNPRCPIAQLPRCKDEFPELREVKPGVWASCHFAGKKIGAA
jgi:hypothetical protein